MLVSIPTSQNIIETPFVVASIAFSILLRWFARLTTIFEEGLSRSGKWRMILYQLAASTLHLLLRSATVYLMLGLCGPTTCSVGGTLIADW